MNRKEERRWIVKLLYAHEFNQISKEYLKDKLSDFDLLNSTFIEEAIVSILTNQDKIDSIISENLSKKSFDKLFPIERAILRVSVNETVIQKNVPTSVSINEAVEIAKEFGNDQSFKLVNGILSSVSKKYD